MAVLSPEIVAELRDLAGQSQIRWFAMGQSWSAKDRADAYLYRLSQVFYENVATGSDVESELETAEANWRKYALEENKKLDAASKFSRGPYVGQSMRMDSYVYPDKFGSTKIHLHNIVKILKEQKCPASE
jgi:hypothetical protein